MCFSFLFQQDSQYTVLYCAVLCFEFKDSLFDPCKKGWKLCLKTFFGTKKPDSIQGTGS